MKNTRLFRRLFGRDAAASSLPARACVQPPHPWGQAAPVWKALWDWLCEEPGREPAPRRALDAARHDFAAALADLTPHGDARDLHSRAASARSLRELWHLRADLYGVVARHRSQAEADRRLQQVNRHFPTRPPAAPAARPGRAQDD